MKTHTLKTWPQYFQAVKDEIKTFELRYNDRQFQVGNRLRLREFAPCATCRGEGKFPKEVGSWVDSRLGHCTSETIPCPDCQGTKGTYTGTHIDVRVTYVLVSDHLLPGYVALGIQKWPNPPGA